MAKSSKTRRGGLRLFSRALSLPTHLLSAAGQSAQRIGSTTGRIAKEALDLPAGVGHNFATHSNMALKEMFSRGGRRATRKGRKQRGGTCEKGWGGSNCNKMLGGGNNMNSSGPYGMGGGRRRRATRRRGSRRH